MQNDEAPCVTSRRWRKPWAREIRRRNRVVEEFPDGHLALMLVAARLRHIASTEWGKRRYLVMETLPNPQKQLDTTARVEQIL